MANQKGAQKFKGPVLGPSGAASVEGLLMNKKGLLQPLEFRGDVTSSWIEETSRAEDEKGMGQVDWGLDIVSEDDLGSNDSGSSGTVVKETEDELDGKSLVSDGLENKWDSAGLCKEIRGENEVSISPDASKENQQIVPVATREEREPLWDIQMNEQLARDEPMCDAMAERMECPGPVNDRLAYEPLAMTLPEGAQMSQEGRQEMKRIKKGQN
ncbi:hypothetical protein F0562_007767 [Nyssa sinensis]|uniref:Uncharacterized protein n=1 Tax=Nyssa sinensis TaxID=561372 RepID=A0A5J5A5G0_9ASTE|nr:hypothetical protein F0562_007767 [Nyssa sinensis]